MVTVKSIKYIFAEELLQKSQSHAPELEQQHNLNDAVPIIAQAIHTSLQKLVQDCSNRYLRYAEERYELDGGAFRPDIGSTYKEFQNVFSPWYDLTKSAVVRESLNKSQVELVLQYLQLPSSKLRLQQSIAARLGIAWMYGSFKKDSFCPQGGKVLMKRSAWLGLCALEAGATALSTQPIVGIAQASSIGLLLFLEPFIWCMVYMPEPLCFYQTQQQGYSYDIEAIQDFAPDHPVWHERTWQHIFTEMFSRERSYWIGEALLWIAINVFTTLIAVGVALMHTERPSIGIAGAPLSFAACIPARVLFAKNFLLSSKAQANCIEEGREQFGAWERAFSRLPVIRIPTERQSALQIQLEEESYLTQHMQLSQSVNVLATQVGNPNRPPMMTIGYGRALDQMRAVAQVRRETLSQEPQERMVFP